MSNISPYFSKLGLRCSCHCKGSIYFFLAPATVCDNLAEQLKKLTTSYPATFYIPNWLFMTLRIIILIFWAFTLSPYSVLTMPNLIIMCSGSSVNLVLSCYQPRNIFLPLTVITHGQTSKTMLIMYSLYIRVLNIMGEIIHSCPKPCFSRCSRIPTSFSLVHSLCQFTVLITFEDSSKHVWVSKINSPEFSVICINLRMCSLLSLPEKTLCHLPLQKATKRGVCGIRNICIGCCIVCPLKRLFKCIQMFLSLDMCSWHSSFSLYLFSFFFLFLLLQYF